MLEVLIAHLEQMRALAAADFRSTGLEWAVLTAKFVNDPPRRPELPKILK